MSSSVISAAPIGELMGMHVTEPMIQRFWNPRLRMREKQHAEPPQQTAPDYPTLRAIGFVFPEHIGHGLLVTPRCQVCGAERVRCPR